MTWPIKLDDLERRLDFKNDRISEVDALRQLRTVKELLGKLSGQPGVVLADEVGMGKTFVALGVTMMAALSDKGRRPVVVMSPPSLHDKWEKDFDVFRELVVTQSGDKNLRAAKAKSGLELFQLIDKEPRARPNIIFLKHGAFHLQNINHWVLLALIKRAMRGMKLGDSKRNALPKFAAGLVNTKSTYKDPALFRMLLDTHCQDWLAVINEYYADEPALCLQDNPIPRAVQKVIDSDDIQVGALRDCLRKLPVNETDSINDRLATLRKEINRALGELWPKAFASAKFRSPLLILDEAHHLKNPATRLASLFVTDEATEDATALRGALEGTFERMLFLTATPFQLGPGELLKVLGRFAGIDWRTLPEYSKQQLETDLGALESALITAQHRSNELDKRWQTLTDEDIVGSGGTQTEVDNWWEHCLKTRKSQSARIQAVLRAYDEALKAMKGGEEIEGAEQPLRTWVVRHLRDRKLPGGIKPRRSRLVGGAIALDGDGDIGLPIQDDALLPFLLAARAQSIVLKDGKKAGRATFAEGLSSSYEAFLDTRNRMGLDEERPPEVQQSARVNKYVDKLREILPAGSAYGTHPKIAPLVDRVLQLWWEGEKVVIFCHYQETGRAIVKHLSAEMESRLWRRAAKRFNLDLDSAQKAVTDFGGRFDADGGMYHPLRDELNKRLAGYSQHLDSTMQERIHDVVRRFIRTPLFVARYFDIRERSGERALKAAFAKRDGSGMTLGTKIDSFMRFIATRCTDGEASEYLDALERIQPGIRNELRHEPNDDLSLLRGHKIMPNVRLANGLVNPAARRKLMLAFNTPLFPEILVASSVLAEGVDLHLNCRHIIHHDLSWNPSTLEQRTGRVDRIGAKAEEVQEPIQIFIPYIGGTQDEKQYRVVMDRERWFQVLMGEDYRTDEAFTEAVSDRVPLPDGIAKGLAFNLAV